MINHGPVILASNHESYLDPPLVGSVSDRAIFFLARKTLLDGRFFGWLLPKLNVIPVDQEGSDRSALKALIRILRAGEGTLVFPEGERTLDGHLQPALPGLGFVIAKTLAPVVPMRIFGAREAWPRGSGKCVLFRPSPSSSVNRSILPQPISSRPGRTFICGSASASWMRSRRLSLD